MVFYMEKFTFIWRFLVASLVHLAHAYLCNGLMHDNRNDWLNAIVFHKYLDILESLQVCAIGGILHNIFNANARDTMIPSWLFQCSYLCPAFWCIIKLQDKIFSSIVIIIISTLGKNELMISKVKILITITKCINSIIEICSSYSIKNKRKVSNNLPRKFTFYQSFSWIFHKTVRAPCYQ